MPRTLPELLVHRVAMTPDCAAWTAERPVTWTEFGRDVEALSFALRDLGVAPGDTVAVMGPTSPEWTLADMGILGAGGVSVGIYSSSTAEQVAFLLRDCGARVALAGSPDERDVLLDAASDTEVETVIAWGCGPTAARAAGTRVLALDDALAAGRRLVARHAREAEALGRGRGPDDTAIVIYTSGTTGRPKGAMLSHANCMASVAATASLVPLDPRADATVSFLPMAHAVERIMSFYGRVYTGVGTTFVGSASGPEIMATLRRARPTVFGAVPRLYEKAYAVVRERAARGSARRRAVLAWAEAVGRACAAHRRAGTDPPFALRVQHTLADRLVFRRVRAGFGGRLSHAIVGAAPIDREVLEFFHAFGLLILEGYGQTECAGLAVVNRREDYRLGTVGRPLPGFEVVTASDGEILIRSPAVFQGYLNLPDETRRAVDRDGWLHTGDVGELEDGWLRITDRKKNLIVTSGGKNVAPAAIETLLAADPLLGPALIVGDGKPYVTALLTLDPAEARAVAGRPDAPLDELARDPAVGARVRAAVEACNRRLARFERVRRYTVLERELTIEDGELTPTLKVRRGAVTERYHARVGALYGASCGEDVVDVEPAGGA